jgi:hypothetical protein
LLKKREQRTKVLVPARMRHAGSWSDVCLVDLSSRGVGLQSAKPPGRGEYVELRRGSHVLIVGRVVWAKGHRFGIRTQDRVWIDGVLRDGGGGEAPASGEQERRAMPRMAKAHEQSRIAARLLQFGFVAGGACCFALLIGSMVSSAIGQPLQAVTTAMTGGSLATTPQR